MSSYTTFKSLLLWCAFSLLINCQSGYEPKSFVEDSSLLTGEFITVDSVYLDDQDSSFDIVSIEEDKVLSVKEDSLSVVVFDRKGNTLFEIDNFGSGPEEYGSINKVGLLNDTIIIISFTDLSVFLYDKFGKLVQKCKLDSLYNSYPTSTDRKLFAVNSNHGIQIHYSSVNDLYTAEKPKEYFANNHLFSTINLSDCTVKNFGTIDIDGVYRTNSNKYFVPLHKPFLNYCRDNNSVYNLMPLERTIYKFDLSSEPPKAVSFKTTPIFFDDPIGEKSYKLDDQLLVRQKNSYYTNIYTSNDKLYLFYIKDRKEKEIYTSDHESNAFEEIFFKRKSLLEMYDMEGNKLFEDIVLSDERIDAIGVKNDTIFFSKSIFSDNVEKLAIFSAVIHER